MDLAAEARRELIESRCGWTVQFGREGLDELKWFVETLENFIAAEESQEVAVLSENAKNKGIEPEGEFWVDHHPYWWEQIFASRLRSSYIISLMSAAEQQVQAVCRDASTILRSGIAPEDIKGGAFERGRKYLEKVAEFNVPEARTWELIGYLYDVRNSFVHNSGMLGQGGHKKRMLHLETQAPGLKVQNEAFVELEREFIGFANQTVETFFDGLADELGRLCDRANKWESGKA